MPFTPSHVAAILPLRGRLSGTLPFAALAIGSVAPDLPYYLPGLNVLSAFTHRAWAVPSIDVALGLTAWLLWRWLAPALHEPRCRRSGAAGGFRRGVRAGGACRWPWPSAPPRTS